ncbi:hypothetical protein AAU61_05680 [Desulfocarbo indianensis]|nr:hypothetical protein AAU61_05680 [Desulfocarbo indianensis]
MKKKSKRTSTPKLRFPEFRKEPGWEEKPLGDFLTESRLLGSKGNVAKKITVKLWGNGVFEKNEAVQGSIHTQYFRRKAGQFVYSKLDFLNQAFGIIPPALDNYESTVDLPCFDIADRLNSVFLLEYVKRKDFYERLGETADGSRKAKRIHAETFLSFPIALPSLPEQHKIAECLSSLDGLITAEGRTLEALKTHKRGLMQQLFPQPGQTQTRLRFPEFEGAGEWETLPLGRVAEVASGQVDPTESPYCDLPHVGGENIESHTGTIRDVKTAKELDLVSGKYAFDENDVLYSKIRPALNKVAAPDFKGICSADIYPIRPSNRELRREYLVYLLLSEGFLEHAIKHSDRSKIPKVNRDTLLSYSISLPTPVEQQRIADCLTALDDRIAAQAAKIESLKTHKRGLMQQLFPAPEVS